jgi:hypothetical protein
MDHSLKKWALKSLTIVPQSNETNAGFWEEAFNDLPPLPGVDNVTVIYHYSRAKAFKIDCWEYFDHILTRRDLFPALKMMYVRSSCGLQRLSPRRWWAIYGSMPATRARGLGPVSCSPSGETIELTFLRNHRLVFARLQWHQEKL